MKSFAKKSAAIFLCIILALSFPTASFAQILQENFSLQIANYDSTDPESKLYAGTTRDIIATITNVSATDKEAIESEKGSILDWSAKCGSSPITGGVTSYGVVAISDAGNGTYTVSERARFTVPEISFISSNGDLIITAAYGATSTQMTVTVDEVSQPITSFTVSETSGDSHSHYDSTLSTLYIDQYSLDTITEENPKPTAVFNVSTSPTNADDTWNVGSTNTTTDTEKPKVDLQATANGFSVTAGKHSEMNSSIIFTTNSGRVGQKIKLVKGVPLTSFKLKTADGQTVADTNSTDMMTIPAVEEQEFDVIPFEESTGANESTARLTNDTYKYTMYTDEACTKPLDKGTWTITYNQIQDANNNDYGRASIKVSHIGNSYLKCETVSVAGENLERTLYSVTAVNVTQANPIDKLAFVNGTTQENMESITVKTTDGTLNMAKYLKITPRYTENQTTDTVEYSIDNTTFAAVNDSTGVLTLKRQGEVTVTARSKESPSITARCKVIIVTPITGITLTPESLDGLADATLPKGAKMQIKATVTPSDSLEKVVYSTPNKDIITLLENGEVSVNEDYIVPEGGTIVEISATSESGTSGKSSCKITVVPAVKAVTVIQNVGSVGDDEILQSSTDNSSYSIRKGSKVKITAALDPNDSNDSIDWRIDIPGVASRLTLDEAKALNYIRSYTKEVWNEITIETNSTANYAMIDVYAYAVSRGQTYDLDSVYSVVHLSFHNLANAEIEGVSPAYSYTGNEIRPTGIKVYYYGTALVEGTDYRLRYSNNVNAGKATVRVEGIGKFTGTKDVDFTIIAAGIPANGVTVATDEQVYDKRAKTPRVTVKNEAGVTLRADTDYTVSYFNNINAGSSAYVIVTGKGNYTGQVLKYFTITPQNASRINVGGIKAVKYTGMAYAPGVNASYADEALVPGYDYYLTYENNVNAGEATVYINGIGNFKGTKKVTFAIEKATESDVIASAISSQTYNGKAKTPAVNLFYNGRQLIQGVDYTLRYSNNVNVGFAGVTAELIGNFKGRKELSFTIKPKSSSISSLSKGKKSFKIKWKKVKNVTGYQIQYSTSKNFKKGTKTSTVKNQATSSKTIRKLKAKKKYYVRVRTYQEVYGKKIYSSWSKTKTVTTK